MIVRSSPEAHVVSLTSNLKLRAPFADLEDQCHCVELLLFIRIPFSQLRPSPSPRIYNALPQPTSLWATIRVEGRPGFLVEAWPVLRVLEGALLGAVLFAEAFLAAGAEVAALLRAFFFGVFVAVEAIITFFF